MTEAITEGTPERDPYDTEANVPGLPSDDELRRAILARVPEDSADLRTAGSIATEKARNGSSLSAANLAAKKRPDHLDPLAPQDALARMRAAKRLVGPGRGADPYQQELWLQSRETDQLSRRILSIQEQLNETTGAKPIRDASGRMIPGEFEPIYKLTGAFRAGREQELSDLLADLAALQGTGGKRRLAAALDEAVAREKAMHRAALKNAAIERRAREMVAEAEIEEAAASRAKFLRAQTGGR